jgi:hypothetical protein
MSDPVSKVSSESQASTLAAIAGYLKKHPVLLFSFGMAIILLAAGTLAFENLRMILGGVLALTVLGLVAWIYQGAQKTSKDRPKTSLDIENTPVTKSEIIGNRTDESGRDVSLKIKGGKVSGSKIIGNDNKPSSKKR